MMRQVFVGHPDDPDGFCAKQGDHCPDGLSYRIFYPLQREDLNIFYLHGF